MPRNEAVQASPRSLIQSVFKHGKKARDGNINLYCRKSDRPEGKSFILIRKEFGNAVSRNRTKRRIREILRHLEKKLNSPFDIIVVVRERVGGLSYEDLDKRLHGLFQKTGMTI